MSGGGVAVTGGHEAFLNVVLASDGKLEHETVAHESSANLLLMKVALVKPGGHGNDLPPKPQSPQERWSRQSGMLGSGGENGDGWPHQKRSLDAMFAP